MRRVIQEHSSCRDHFFKLSKYNFIRMECNSYLNVTIFTSIVMWSHQRESNLSEVIIFINFVAGMTLGIY